MNQTLDRFRYDDAIVRKFMVATFVWGLVGMLVGLFIALQLAVPALNVSPFLTFGRLRPLHTNAVIFAFAGNAFFMGAYYSTQRLLKAHMFSDLLSNLHFWGWQAIIVSAALTLPLGFTQAKEYAELEWPLLPRGFAMGAMTGLLPCGWLWAFVATAAEIGRAHV